MFFYKGSLRNLGVLSFRVDSFYFFVLGFWWVLGVLSFRVFWGFRLYRALGLFGVLGSGFRVSVRVGGFLFWGGFSALLLFLVREP